MLLFLFLPCFHLSIFMSCPAFFFYFLCSSFIAVSFLPSYICFLLSCLLIFLLSLFPVPLVSVLPSFLPCFLHSLSFLIPSSILPSPLNFYHSSLSCSSFPSFSPFHPSFTLSLLLFLSISSVLPLPS